MLRGVPETAMPSFRSLPPAQRDALVNYVRFLSVRGLFERAVIVEVTIGLDEDERLLDPKQKEISPTAYVRNWKCWTASWPTWCAPGWMRLSR